MVLPFLPLILLTAGSALARPQLGSLGIGGGLGGSGSSRSTASSVDPADDADLESSSLAAASVASASALDTSSVAATVAAVTTTVAVVTTAAVTTTTTTVDAEDAASTTISTLPATTTVNTIANSSLNSTMSVAAESASSSNVAEPFTTATASSSKVSISYTGTPSACEEFSFSLAGGQPPYTVGVFNTSDTANNWDPLEILTNGTDTGIKWTVTYAPESSIYLGVRDANSTSFFTEWLTVGEGKDLSCLNDPGKKNTTTTTSDSSKSKDKAKGKPISTVAIVMIVLGAVACLLIIAVVIWALRRRNKNKLMREPISFDPQPTTRFEIESDCDNSADYHGAEVTPYIPSPRTSMAMAQASRDPMSYGMHYSSANPFADQNPFDPSPYGVASTYSQPTAYPYSRGGIASTTRDPTRLPALSVVTGAEPDMVRRDRAFNPFENPLPPLPADKQPKYHTTAGATSQQAVLGFVPVRSGSVRSDSSNTTRRSSIDRPFGPLSAVNEEAEVEDMYQPHMAGIPEHEPYGNARW